MKWTYCSQEDAAARGVRSGHWPDEIRAHTESCSVCREAARAVHLMERLADVSDAGTADHEDAKGRAMEAQVRSLPDPILVWQRAQLPDHVPEKNWPLEWLLIAGAAAPPVGLASWIAYNWNSIQTLSAQFLLSGWPQLSGLTWLFAALVPAVLTLAALSLGYPLLDTD